MERSYNLVSLKCNTNNLGKGCGKNTHIKNIKYIQTYFYIPPSGCYEGDYWVEGEMNWICEKCNHRNRVLDKNIKMFKSKFNMWLNEY